MCVSKDIGKSCSFLFILCSTHCGIFMHSEWKSEFSLQLTYKCKRFEYLL